MKTTTLRKHESAVLGAGSESFAKRPRAAAVRDLAARRAHDVLAEKNRLLELQNKELQHTVHRLRRLAYVDRLTGLANRHGFELMLHSEIRRASRAGAPLALLLCDVDHFKRLNDTFGHQTGDSVLGTLGGILSGYCRRAGDLGARYGGEEFALLLPGAAFQEAMGIAERLRRRVEGLSIQSAERVLGRITLSIGVTTFHSRTPCSPSELIRAADEALYRAKEAGRNRTRYQSIA